MKLKTFYFDIKTSDNEIHINYKVQAKTIYSALIELALIWQSLYKTEPKFIALKHTKK